MGRRSDQVGRRIALVTRRFAPLIGGAERVMRYLAEALAELGHDVTVLTSNLNVEHLPRDETLPVHGGSYRVVRLGTARLRLVGTWLHMRDLRLWLEQHPPEIAYVSMLKHDAHATLQAAQRQGFPVVLRPEGAGATGDLAWQGHARFGARIARSCHQADAVVAISRAVRDELLTAGYAKTRVHELPNGVPVPEAPWQRRTFWREAPTAVYAGRLAPEKGLEGLIDAWPIVRRHQPDARMILVGEGPARLGLEHRIARLALTGAVELAGHQDDVTPWLRQGDLFVLPSREEGMSLALLEAMALGMPLVASSIPGNRKLVSDFKQGRLYPLGDAEALARTILEQWAEFDRALHMGRAARSLVQQKYSIEAMARGHLAMFESILSSRPATRRSP